MVAPGERPACGAGASRSRDPCAQAPAPPCESPRRLLLVVEHVPPGGALGQTDVSPWGERKSGGGRGLLLRSRTPGACIHHPARSAVRLRVPAALPRGRSSAPGARRRRPRGAGSCGAAGGCWTARGAVCRSGPPGAARRGFHLGLPTPVNCDHVQVCAGMGCCPGCGRSGGAWRRTHARDSARAVSGRGLRESRCARDACRSTGPDRQ